MDTKPSTLRLLAAVNLLKSFLLGDLHIPGRPQTHTVQDAISRLNLIDQAADGELLTGRTWLSWFTRRPVTPKRSKVQVLDIIGGALTKQNQDIEFADNFFEALVCGGLMASMTMPSRSNDLRYLVNYRAMKYVPLTPLHLFLDAVDAAGRTEPFGEVGADELRVIAALRLADLLHEKWNPRSGYFYKETRSDFRVAWDEAGAQQKRKMKQDWDAVNPSIFPKLMNQGAAPDWSLSGSQIDYAPQQIHQLLLSMACDTKFLVEERLRAWTLDMTSAAMILFARGWSSRYEMFGVSPSAESLFLEGFIEAFLYNDDFEIAAQYIEPAFWISGCQCCLDGLALGRKALRVELGALGISPQDLNDVMGATRSNQPLVY